ncbi:MAG: hypothetical protein HGA90_05545, partial [Alphaproteobacteria bacterium]|nr:hypothetical protein [Alphaproteobacteria bacterium]
MAFRFLLALFLALCFMPLAQAATPSSDPKLAACLKRAEELPDFTAAEAEGWMKRGGGDAARLCRATAQFHRGEYANAAREYVTLAATHDKKDRKEVASLHARAALAFTRASDSKNAEA